MFFIISGDNSQTINWRHSCLKMPFFFLFRKSKVITQLTLDYHITYAYRVFSHQTVLIYIYVSISSLQSTGRQHTQRQCKKWYFDILFMNSFSCIHSSVWSKHLSPNTCRWIMLFFVSKTSCRVGFSLDIQGGGLLILIPSAYLNLEVFFVSGQ